MIITTPKELKNLRRSGKGIRAALTAMELAAVPGVTMLELDAICGRVLAENDMKSAPRRVYKFPGESCISVNDEALHGVPTARKLVEGDLLKLDLVAERHGWYTDAAVTLIVGKERNPIDVALIDCAENAFVAGLHEARIGSTTDDIGAAVHKKAREYGFDCLLSFGGHGVGKTIHEEPFVPNYIDTRPDRHENTTLIEGLVITIEPIIVQKSGEWLKDVNDGWTIRTKDGGRVAHYEHTICIQKDGPVILTE